jgi:hypothetical protein
MVVIRVVFRLLRKLPSASHVEEVVRDSLPLIRSLPGKLTLLNVVGHEEGVGHGLVSAEASSQFEAALRDEVRSASPDRLAAESDLFRLLAWTKRMSGENEPALQIPADPNVGCTLLLSAVTDVRSQALGTRALTVEKRLYWDGLVDLTGSEDAIRQFVERCRGKSGVQEAVELADKYLSGWRPEGL